MKIAKLLASLVFNVCIAIITLTTIVTQIMGHPVGLWPMWVRIGSAFALVGMGIQVGFAVQRGLDAERAGKVRVSVEVDGQKIGDETVARDLTDRVLRDLKYRAVRQFGSASEWNRL